MIWTIPNIISMSRVVLIILSITGLYYGNFAVRVVSTILILLSFLLDWIDGWVARTINQGTVIGSMIDVIADRLTEYILWIFFLGLGLVPLWAPLIVIPRGVITDFIRSRATARGVSVYDLPKSWISKFLVKSRIMRGLIGLSKLCLFTILGLELAGIHLGLVYPLVIITVILNLSRGLPVILEASNVS